jgi:hypothetical protein
METLKSGIGYFCESIGLISSKQCDTLLNLRKEKDSLLTNIITNLIDFKSLYEEFSKYPKADIILIKPIIDKLLTLLNDKKIEKLLFEAVDTHYKFRRSLNNQLTNLYYSKDILKLLDNLYADYCEGKKYYDVRHLYNRPCSDAIFVIEELSKSNERVRETNKKLDVLIKSFKTLNRENILSFKQKTNFTKKSKKDYSSELLNYTYYLLYLDYNKKDEKYYTRARQYSLTTHNLGNYIDSEELEGLIYGEDDEDDIEQYQKEEYKNLLKYFNDFYEKSGDYYNKYIDHTKLCLESRNTIRNETEIPENIFILVDLTNNQIVFSFNVDSFGMIYDLCKTSREEYKDIRTNEILKAYLNKAKTKHFVYLDFNEPNYEKTIAFLIRSGFYIKGPTIVPNTMLKKHMNESQIYLLLSYDKSKANKINYNTLNVENLLAIASKIKVYETNMKTKIYELENESLRKILAYVCNWSKEISGSFTEKSKREFDVLQCLDININLNEGSKLLESDYDVIGYTKDACRVTILTFNIINFHTHPVNCYIEKNTSNHSFSSPPSRADIYIQFTDTRSIYNIVNDKFRTHLVFTLECIYSIQIHPYWIYKLKKKGITFSNDFFEYLKILIENFKKFDLTNNSILGDKLAIIELFYFYNNKFNFNELAKDIEHSKISELKLHPSTLTKEDDIRKWYKTEFYSSDLDRNMNLFIFNIIPYPWKPTSELSKMNMWDIPNHLITRMNSSSIDEMTNYVIDNLSSDNVNVPYTFI